MNGTRKTLSTDLCHHLLPFPRLPVYDFLRSFPSFFLFARNSPPHPPCVGGGGFALKAEMHRDNDVMRGLKRNLLRETAMIAFLLGCCLVVALGFIFHAITCTRSTAEYALGVYIIVVHIVFHSTEFLVATTLRPHDAHPDAFMLFHSTEYMVASAVPFVEFAIEILCVPESWKLPPSLGSAMFRLSFLGSTVFGVMTLFFYGIRIVAMLQCSLNFSLHVESSRRSDHVLVESGVYSVLRHPAYFGWFWRTMLAQFILANPLSVVAHTIITWCFLAKRIPYEEKILERADFFGELYTTYRRKTYVGIPFIA